MRETDAISDRRDSRGILYYYLYHEIIRLPAPWQCGRKLNMQLAQFTLYFPLYFVFLSKIKNLAA